MSQGIMLTLMLLLALAGKMQAYDIDYSDDITYSEGYIPQGGVGVVTVYSTIESNHYNGVEIHWTGESMPAGLTVTQVLPTEELLVTYPLAMTEHFLHKIENTYKVIMYNTKDFQTQYVPLGNKVPMLEIYFEVDESFSVGDEIILDVNHGEYSLFGMSIWTAGTKHGLPNKQIVLHIVEAGAPTPYAHLSPDGTTLTFFYDGMMDYRPGTVYKMNGVSEYPDWTDETVADGITQVKFDASFADYRPSTVYEWFYMLGQLSRISGMEYLNTSDATEATGMFLFCDQLTSLDVSHFDTSNVTDMWAMFYGCSGLTSLDVSHFDTSNVTDLTGMFYGCSSLANLDVSSFDTSNASSLNGMFYGCTSLTSLDVSHFDIGSNTDTGLMFAYCYGLDHLYVSPAMENLASDACTGVGTASNPCIIHAPEGFNFGVSTTGTYFQWKGGYFQLAIDAILGDVNADEMLTISDPVCIFGWLLEVAQSTFVERVADFNQDTYITVSDGVAIIAYLQDPNAVARRHPAPALNAAHDALRLATNANGFGLALDNESTFTAFSLDITLPEGETLRNVALDPRRTDGHTLSWRQLADGTFRILCFSPTLQPIAGEEGLLLTVETDGPFSGSVVIDNIRFSNLVGQEKVLAPLANTPTGIDMAESATPAAPRYTLDGKRLGGKSRGIYIQNGKKMVMK